MVSSASLSHTTCNDADNLTGWWLARRVDHSASGWAPAAYLEEVKQAPAPPPVAARPPPPPAPAATRLQGNGLANGAPASKAKPAAPTPPAKRPAGRKPAPGPGGLTTPRDSGYANGGNSSGGSGAVTPNSQNGGGGGLAGGLAEALRARQKAMKGGDEDGDW